jgi:hypothetical protein
MTLAPEVSQQKTFKLPKPISLEPGHKNKVYQKEHMFKASGTK